MFNDIIKEMMKNGKTFDDIYDAFDKAMKDAAKPANDYMKDDTGSIEEGLEYLLTTIASDKEYWGKLSNEDIEVLRKSIGAAIGCGVELLLAQKSGNVDAWDIIEKYMGGKKKTEDTCTGDCSSCGNNDKTCEDDEKPKVKTHVSVKAFDQNGKEFTLKDAEKMIKDFLESL